MKKFNSKTIIGIIIAFMSVIIGAVARQSGAPITEAETAELLEKTVPLTEQLVNLAVQMLDTIGAMIGLYLAYRGRMNPDIKPIAPEVLPKSQTL
jgi:hypothetical protein